MAFPNNSLSSDAHILKAKKILGIEKESCIVVGNGPSAPYSGISEREIKSSHIFRANWFFLEKEQYFGKEVDAFFWSVDNKKLRESLAALVVQDLYTIRSFFQPFKASDDSEKLIDETTLFRKPVFDHWSIIANDPVLARFMMGRPLPTQGMQMIAVAAILGYKKIIAAGIDMYQDEKRRYAHDVPVAIKGALLEKDLSPGYEKNHSLDTDLMFLRAIRSRYKFELIGNEKLIRLAPFFNTVNISKDNEVTNTQKPKLKKAFVTLADGAHAIGAITLARSLSRVTTIPLIVLYSTDSTPYFLNCIDNVVLRKIEPISNPNKPKQRRFLATYTKLRIFEMLDYDRLVYVDADCIVRKSIDDLFDGNETLVAPDWGIEITEQFNSGLIAFTPSHELRELVFASIDNAGSYDGGDQGYLNIILKDRHKRLPPEYNTLKRLVVSHPHIINYNDVKVFHYVGKKPWELESCSREFGDYDMDWSSYLTQADIPIVFSLWKRIVNLENLSKSILENKLTPSNDITKRGAGVAVVDKFKLVASLISEINLNPRSKDERIKLIEILQHDEKYKDILRFHKLKLSQL
jgi:lipopolysaccharide biosynthesis glycosyltransferase